MILNLNDYSIYIKPGVTDMRKRGESLSFVVRSEMCMDPYLKSVFLFCGRDRKRVTAVVWDGNGWLEFSKRLECGMCYKWPKDREEAMSVTAEEVDEMLRGGNPWRRFPTFEKQ